MIPGASLSRTVSIGSRIAIVRLGEFFAGFLQVDPAFWYRPLTQRTVQSVLFPLVELDPVPYRIVGFVLFFACTLAVFWLAESLTQSRRIAWFSVLIFTPHLIHAFTTYDVAFTPELAFTLFYIVSAAFFVRYLRTKNRNALVASVILFVASLFSKEAATALPFGLLAIWFLLPRENRGSAWCLFPHFAILGIYLAFAVGYLHVRHIDVVHPVGKRVHARQSIRSVWARTFCTTSALPSAGPSASPRECTATGRSLLQFS